MEISVRRLGWLPGVVIAVTACAALLAILYPFVSEAIATTVAIGVGVGVAVFVDRRWLRPSESAVRQALGYGAATAFGWAVAQLIIYYW